MDQRERQQPLRTPRRLRELQQRARRLQEKRRAAGQSPLAAAELAEALGCSRTRLQEADAVQRALGVASLDQPLGDGDGEEQSGSWLEQISERSPRSRDGDDSQLQWLRRRLGGLEAADRELLEARWIDGLSWSAVAERMGLDCRQCRQRAGALQRALQAASSQVEASRAKAAARAV